MLSVFLTAFIVSGVDAAAQKVKVFCFYDGEKVHLRWQGSRTSADPVYEVYRFVEGSSTTPQKIATSARTSEIKEIQRIAGTKTDAYLGMFKAESRSLVSEDYTKIFTNKLSLGMFNAFSVCIPEIGRILGELITDSTPPKNSRIKYIIHELANAVDRTLGESDFIETKASGIVPSAKGASVLRQNESCELRWSCIGAQQESGEVVAWNVYRAQELLGPYIRINPLPVLPIQFGTESGEQSFADPAADPSQVYYYYIKSVNAVGAESAASEALYCSADAALKPPIVIRAAQVGEAISLQWKGVLSGGADNHYLITRIENKSKASTQSVIPAYNYQSSINWYDTDLPASGVYRYVIQSSNNGSLSSPSDTVDVNYSDTRAPSAPLNLRAEQKNNLIVLSWDEASPTAPLGYEVERFLGTTAQANSRLTASAITQRSFVDTLVPTQSGYLAYSVFALSSSYVRSPAAKVTVRLIDKTAPSAPTITSFTVRKKNLSVSWSPSIEKDFKSYVLYRSADKKVWIEILRTVEAKVLIKLDSAGSFQFSVTALDSSNNESQKSIERSVVVYNDKPAAPLSATAQLQGDAIIIRWQKPMDNQIAGYTIWKKSAAGKRVRIAECKKDLQQFTDYYSDTHTTQSYEICSFTASGELSDPTACVYEAK